MKRRETGILGEKLAAGHLKRHGYKILETNYRCRGGEIDIIARDGDTLVFVEVRAKSGRSFGSPEESINATKMSRLRTAAAHYGMEHTDLPAGRRIDVVAIDLDKNGRALRIEIIPDAVGGE